MTRLLFIAVLLFSAHFCFAQNCETFNRELFRMLPKDVPNEINCVDSLGRKQGWWIYYKIEYNPDDIPDVQKKGYYVYDYYCGKYNENKKTGEWIRVNNNHLIYISMTESYYYSRDTILVNYEGFIDRRSSLYFNNDSTIINFFSVDDYYKDTICIECRRKNNKVVNNCKLYYQNKLMKSFPYKNLEFEIDKAWFRIDRQKYIRLININSK